MIKFIVLILSYYLDFLTALVYTISDKSLVPLKFGKFTYFPKLIFADNLDEILPNFMLPNAVLPNFCRLWYVVNLHALVRRDRMIKLKKKFFPYFK